MSVDYQTVIGELYAVEQGVYRATNGGFLTVAREKDEITSVAWTSGRDSHNPFKGSSECVYISNREIVAYFVSALSVWLKWGYGRGKESDFEAAKSFASKAHNQLCRQKAAS